MRGRVREQWRRQDFVGGVYNSNTKGVVNVLRMRNNLRCQCVCERIDAHGSRP